MSGDVNFGQRLDQFVGNLSTVQKTDFQSRMKRLTPNQREFMLKALEIFREAKFTDSSALQTFLRGGGDHTLTRIEKVLKGDYSQVTQTKVKGLGADHLFSQLQEAKDIRHRRLNPFEGFKALSSDAKLARLEENEKWEGTFLKAGLLGVKAAAPDQGKMEERMRLLVADYQKWMGAYEDLSGGDYGSTIKSVLERQIALQQLRLVSFVKLQSGEEIDPKAIAKMVVAINEKMGEAFTPHTLNADSAAFWLRTLNEVINAPSEQLQMLSLLREKEGSTVFQKLQIAILSGTDIKLSQKEEDWLVKVSGLKHASLDKDPKPPLSLANRFQLWFLQVMTSGLVKELKVLQQQVTQILNETSAFDTSLDQVHVLHREINRAEKIQQTYPNPILQGRIESAKSRLHEVLSQIEERQKEGGYLFFKKQLLKVAEIDQQIALVGQLELIVGKTWVDSIKKGEKDPEIQNKALQQVKGKLNEWVVENPTFRSSTLVNEILNAKSSNELAEVLEAAYLSIGKLRDERNLIFSHLHEEGWVTDEGTPNFDAEEVIHFFEDKGKLEEREDAMLAERTIALQMAEEIALYTAAEKAPAVFGIIQDSQRKRLEEVDAALERPGIGDFHQLYIVYDSHRKGLSEIVGSYNASMGARSEQIQARQQQRLDQLQSLENSARDRYGRYLGLQKDFEAVQGQMLETEGTKVSDLKSDVNGLFDRKLYANEDGIDKAVGRAVFLYDLGESEKPTVLGRKLFVEHRKVLAPLGWDEERMVNLATVLAGAELSSINSKRAYLLYGVVKDGGAIYTQAPHLAFVRNKQNDYELYAINVASVATNTTASVEEGYDISVVRVVLDGKAVDKDRKPFKDAIKEVKISPPLYFDKSELEKELKIETADSPNESALKTDRYPLMLDQMLQVMVDSIPDQPFRDGTRHVLTSYKKNLPKE